MKPFSINLEKESLKNKFYRKVVYTDSKIQLVLMSLKVGEDIPLEIHKNHDQFIRVESGKAIVKIDNKKIILGDGSSVIIPAGSFHYVGNYSKKLPLKLYTIYSPPEHPPRTVHKTFDEAKRYHH